MTPGRCKGCGCTDHNACTAKTSTGRRIGCSWIEPDLCSACTPGAGKHWRHPVRVAALMKEPPGVKR